MSNKQEPAKLLNFQIYLDMIITKSTFSRYLPDTTDR